LVWLVLFVLLVEASEAVESTNPTNQTNQTNQPNQPVSPINELIDQLLARDGEYRPVELLILLRRLDRSSLALFERESGTVLEDALFGDLDRVLEQLNHAADRARSLGLEARTEARRSGQGQWFRRATADHQARTVWTRAEPSAQADLFLDNALAVARRELTRALQQADRLAGEAALVDLSRIDAGADLLADAEHLVGALGWLEDDGLNAVAVIAALEDDLALRAKRLLGRADGQRFIARVYAHLARNRSLDDGPAGQLSRAELHERAGEASAALEALDRLAAEAWSTRLRLVELRTSLALGQRERALQALSWLCWTDPQAAEDWLEQGHDDELARRVEQFWDLEAPLETALFPAWLLARGYPIPEVEAAPRMDAARALENIRLLRQDPSNIEARGWLQNHAPALMAHWMKERG